MYAAASVKQDCLQILLDGYQFGSQDKNGFTALRHAFGAIDALQSIEQAEDQQLYLQCCMQSIQLLFKSEAHFPSADGVTTLMLCAKNGSLMLAQSLLEAQSMQRDDK